MKNDKIKKCKHCGKIFKAQNRELKRGNGKYCSLSCAAQMPKSLQYS